MDERGYVSEEAKAALRESASRLGAFPLLLAVAKAAWSDRNVALTEALVTLDTAHPGWRDW